MSTQSKTTQKRQLNKTLGTVAALASTSLPGGSPCFMTSKGMRRHLLAPGFHGIAFFTAVLTCRHMYEDKSKFFHNCPNIGASISLDLRANEWGWDHSSGSVVSHRWCCVVWESVRVASSDARPCHTHKELGVGGTLWFIEPGAGGWGGGDT